MLIYGNEAASTASQASEDQMAAYAAFGREVSERGLLLSDEALHPTHTATTVRVRDGKLQTLTREQLGGVYLLQCQDLDEAIEVAAKIPGARRGSIEIRPFLEWR